jgi:hypothetical protein
MQPTDRFLQGSASDYTERRVIPSVDPILHGVSGDTFHCRIAVNHGRFRLLTLELEFVHSNAVIEGLSCGRS